MTNDIKGIVERCNIAHQEMLKAGVNGWTNVLTEAIAALTTLSEDNAAMKLEIERLKKLLVERCNFQYEVLSSSDTTKLNKHNIAVRQALKDTP